MAVVRLNFSPKRPARGDGQGWSAPLRAALAQTPVGAPICLLIHGYRYHPERASRDPHQLIFSTGIAHRDATVVSWPHHLGFGSGRRDEGLCIALGWPSDGTIWRAYRRAEMAGQALAEVFDLLAASPQNPTSILCHSLGARVALVAAAAARQPRLARMIIMAGAEHADIAQETARNLSPEGTEFYNICSRGNDLFDALFEIGMGAAGKMGRALGQGLNDPPPNWLNIQIDAPETRLALQAFGAPIAAPLRPICHWSGYKRPGLFRFYRRLIREPDAHLFATLAQALPSQPSTRWSRFRGHPRGLCAVDPGRRPPPQNR